MYALNVLFQQESDWRLILELLSPQLEFVWLPIGLGNFCYWGTSKPLLIYKSDRSKYKIHHFICTKLICTGIWKLGCFQSLHKLYSILFRALRVGNMCRTRVLMSHLDEVLVFWHFTAQLLNGVSIIICFMNSYSLAVDIDRN